MASTKKRRRRRASGGAHGNHAGAARTAQPKEAARPAARPGGATPERRERKEQARRARDSARRRAQRRATLRRAGAFTVVGAIAIGTVYFLNRAASPRPIPEEAVRAAETAGCSEVDSPIPQTDATGGQHLAPGQPFTYGQQPATSGLHDPSSLSTDQHVLEEPVPETQAVHNLEHAAAIIYYRADGEDALAQAVVDRLAGVANDENNVLMAPYPNLPSGTSLALTAWNKLQTCPASVEPALAATIARGFIQAFVCTGNAPEPQNGEGC
jgi:uncharacterized protein DUF3105